MDLILLNTPNRDSVDTFPPYAILALKKYLANRGLDQVEVMDVDYHRPTISQIINELREKNPTVVGISAVVSTSYAFTKELSLAIKEAMPLVTVIVGGNLAASAEVLIKKANVDFCVIGEGELILYKFLMRYKERGPEPEHFKDIPGLVFLDSSGAIVNTGYEEEIPAEILYEIDYEDLQYGIDAYFPKMFDQNGQVALTAFAKDERTFEPQRRHQRYFQFIIGKGCVAKCTFCHRWDKGIRHIPVDLLMARLDYLIEHFDVGFINAQIEAFACDKRWLQDFCQAIKSRGLLWEAGAVRAKSIDRKTIDLMHESGCVSVIYGFETGSPKMLEVMEKKTTLEENIRAQELNISRGYYNTIIQLVIGMPGETPETIKETSDFVSYCMTLSPHLNPHNISTNFALALPGTPLYEFGRRKGLIESTLDGEERYLLAVSNVEASSHVNAINFTECPTLEIWSWKYRIQIDAAYAFFKKYSAEAYYRAISERQKFPLIEQSQIEASSQHGLMALLKRIVSLDTSGLLCYHPIFMFRIKGLLPYLMLLKAAGKIDGARIIYLLIEYFRFKLTQKINKNGVPARSLRKIVEEQTQPIKTDSVQLLPLRKGRW